jgi:hypothetical protein
VPRKVLTYKKTTAGKMLAPKKVPSRGAVLAPVGVPGFGVVARKPPAKFNPEPVEMGKRDLAKWEKLKLEYDRLKQERSKIRLNIVELDARLASGAISERDRDKEFRTMLVRAGDISRQISQIVCTMSEIGKVPEDYAR